MDIADTRDALQAALDSGDATTISQVARELRDSNDSFAGLEPLVVPAPVTNAVLLRMLEKINYRIRTA